jgi:hypothetical protein
MTEEDEEYIYFFEMMRSWGIGYDVTEMIISKKSNLMKGMIAFMECFNEERLEYPDNLKAPMEKELGIELEIKNSSLGRFGEWRGDGCRGEVLNIKEKSA